MYTYIQQLDRARRFRQRLHNPSALCGDLANRTKHFVLNESYKEKSKSEADPTNRNVTVGLGDAAWLQEWIITTKTGATYSTVQLVDAAVTEWETLLSAAGLPTDDTAPTA